MTEGEYIRKVLAGLLVMLSLAFGVAQGGLMLDDPARAAEINSGLVGLEELSVPGAVTETPITIEDMMAAGAEDSVSVADPESPMIEDDGPLPAQTPQEGEPAETSIYAGLMLVAIIGLFLTGMRMLGFTFKRRARTLLFQPRAT